MPQYSSTRRVSHSASAMLDLVADIESYAEFLPYCIEAKILRRSHAPDGKEVLLASMTVGYGPIRESFVSRATIDRERLRLAVQYVDGPFQRLDNRWSFKPTGEASCDVEFYIEYAFKSRAFELLAGSLFDRLFRKMSDAFVARADIVSKRNSGAAQV